MRDTCMELAEDSMREKVAREEREITREKADKRVCLLNTVRE